MIAPETAISDMAVLIFNGYTFWVEYKVVRENTEMIPRDRFKDYSR